MQRVLFATGGWLRRNPRKEKAMTQIEAMGRIYEACCVPNELKVELVGYVLRGQGPQYVAEVAGQLSEGFMPLADLYWRDRERRESGVVS